MNAMVEVEGDQDTGGFKGGAARSAVRRAGACSHLALLLLAGISIVLGFAGESAAAPARIREIRIVRGNVFLQAEAERYRIFQAANFLHITTHEHVVRRELLFTEGDLIDEDLLAATERALRALEFVNEARVRVLQVDEATVDVEVYTQDAWTIIPGILFETGGGLTEVGVTGTDTNLGGFGKKVWLEGVHKSDVGTSFAAGYKDPQVLGSRWLASTNFRAGPLVDSVDLSIVHPFYSPDTKWAYSGYGRWRDEIVRLFDSGTEFSRIRESSQYAQVFAARAFGQRYRKLTADFLFQYDDKRYQAIEGTRTSLPEDELTLTSSVGLFWREESWVKDKHIHKMTITEDIQLGFLVGARVGRAGIPIPKGEKRWTFNGSYRYAFVPGKRQYLFLSSGVSSEDDRNTILSTSSVYYHRWTPWQTLALNVKFARAWDLDSSTQFTLGGESGLRGFPARRFNGDKSLLINAESRFYSPVEILTVALGAVAFVDMGRVWERGSRVDLKNMGYSAGFGLRMGFTRAPNEPTGRIDFGWPLSEGGFAVSVSAEQQF